MEAFSTSQMNKSAHSPPKAQYRKSTHKSLLGHQEFQFEFLLFSSASTLIILFNANQSQKSTSEAQMQVALA